MSAKCPHCGKVVTRVNLETLEIYQNFKPSWHGVAYTCSACNTILSVGMDPILLRNDTIEGVVQALSNR